jgi:signal transduction histidine kinase
MNETTIFLVDRSEKPSGSTRKAAQEAFPSAKFISVSTVSDAVQQTSSGGRQLLVLTDPDEAEIVQAAQAMDAENLPRWATVVLGRNSSELVEAVSPEECSPPLLRRVFRSAMQQHELMRENLRLGGDLKTVACRLRHDLLSPLNCINISCDLIKELLGDHASLVQRQLGVIDKSMAEVAQMIDRVSELLNASTDSRPANAVCMEDVIDTVLSQLEPELQEGGAIVERPANWPQVKGVAKWIEIIWWNLINNAIQHSEPSAPIHLGWNRNGKGLRFWVSNRGEAVPPEIEPRLFPRFDQLHRLPSSGLGLCVVERLVLLQGGHCGYERLDNHSSVFYFTLPGKQSVAT